MKIKNCLLVVAVMAAAFSLQPDAVAQGSLTPPGAPAPTMKTADQIYAKLEPRIVINAVNTPGDSANLFIITNPGSYYLTTNIVGVSGKNGIGISGNNITLDLNGFVLQGTAGSLDGINFPYTTTNSNIEVRNGIITGWPGVGFFATGAFNLLFDHLNISSNSIGIRTGNTGATVRNCIVSQNSNRGINCDGGSARITGCTIENNGNTGILLDGSVADCLVRNNGAGINIQEGSVTGCTIIGNHDFGVYASGPSLIVGNTCIKNNTNNVGTSGGIVIDELAGQCRIENNQLTGNGASGIQIRTGLFGSGANKNIVIKNTATGNGLNNYIVPGGNVFGPIANDSGGTITNSSPWGNFSF